MRCKIKYPVRNTEDFKGKLLAWCSQFPVYCFLDSNSSDKSISGNHLYCNYNMLAAVGAINSINVNAGNAFEQLRNFHHQTKDWIFGILGYDLKNETEKLSSDNFDGLLFNELHFFQPELVFILNSSEFEIHYLRNQYKEEDIYSLFKEINRFSGYSYLQKNGSIPIIQRINKDCYIGKIKELKKHILKGDIYEINFCQEYYNPDIIVYPTGIFQQLLNYSPAPFSCIFRFKDKYLISASPERYLLKKGNTIVSQPMKGTIRRSCYPEDDRLMIRRLKSDAKEISENIMIVDLVRNDLSKTAVDRSVKVEELCGIYTYKTVHQMVSTIKSELNNLSDGIDAIRNSFPMGSMTGAPKVRAMKLIEEFEETKRGVFSGAAGYFTPHGDFDFNVVIRSILYNETNRYLSFITGSAITHKSDPYREFEECQLKAASLKKTLGIEFY